MRPRHLGRELALKALYQLDIRGEITTEDLALFFERFASDTDAHGFAGELVSGVRAQRELLDRHIAAALQNWTVERLSKVDHNILRIAVFELVSLEEVPARVTIDEAIELAKQYGDENSGRFVNGVLDQVATQLNLKGKGEEGHTPKPH